MNHTVHYRSESWKAGKDSFSLARSPCLQEAASKASTTQICFSQFSHMQDHAGHVAHVEVLNHGSREPHDFYMNKSLGTML